MRPKYKKPFFGSEYMYFQDYYNQSVILSNYCITLGLLYKDDIGALLELLGNSKSDMESKIRGISEMAELIETQSRLEIKNTLDLFSESPVKGTIKFLFKGKNLDYRNINDLLKIKDEKISKISKKKKKKILIDIGLWS